MTPTITLRATGARSSYFVEANGVYLGMVSRKVGGWYALATRLGTRTEGPFRTRYEAVEVVTRPLVTDESA